MRSSFPIGFNPLPWFYDGAGYNRPAAPALRVIYEQIRAAGFGALQSEVPDGMSVAEYAELLQTAGVAPAPGYFAAPFAESAAVEQAKRAAEQHIALGLTRIFIADGFGANPRMATPAVGAAFDAGRLRTVTENLGAAAEAMAAEGVLACLHQHVATWIETPEETAAVLEAIPGDVLLFGPDTGHLAWAGANPADFIKRYRARVGAVHLKDIHEHAARGVDYRGAARQHVRTEPGGGDINFQRVLTALEEFSGWYVVEVDVPDQASARESATVSAEWIRTHFERDIKAVA
jgi:inosose dehydratase